MLKSFTFVYVRLLNKEGLSSAFPYCGQFRRAYAHASFILRPLLIWQFKIRNDLADLFCFFCVPSFQISQGQQQVGTRCNISRFSVKLVHRTDTPKWQQQEQMRHQHAQQQLPRGLSCKFTYLFFPSMMIPECNTTFFISESLFPPIRRFLRSRYSPTADNKSSVELYIDLLFYAGTYHTLLSFSYLLTLLHFTTFSSFSCNLDPVTAAIAPSGCLLHVYRNFMNMRDADTGKILWQESEDLCRGYVVYAVDV